MEIKENLLNNYTLRCKDLPLVRFSLYVTEEHVQGVTKKDYGVKIDKVVVENQKLLPKRFSKGVTSEGLKKWIQDRKAPKNRQFVDKIMLAIEDDNNPLKYVDITHALSLNDAYWITNDLVEHKWQNFNLYQNCFDEVLANVAFTGYSQRVSGAVTTPELTSGGALKKCWSNRPEGIFLLKGDDFAPSKDGRSQVTNEYYAAQVAEAMGLNYVPYDLEEFKHRDGTKEIVSVCKLFTTEDIGYIDAYTYLKYCGIEDPDAEMRTLKGQMKVAELCGEELYADMMLFDSIIGNRDRHSGNFGMLVNNNTGKIIGMAPIFDNGYSMLYGAAVMDLLPENIDNYVKSLSCKYLSFDEQAQLFVAERHLVMLQQLGSFEFRRHSKYNIDDGTLQLMEKFIRQRAIRAVELFQSKVL